MYLGSFQRGRVQLSLVLLSFNSSVVILTVIMAARTSIDTIKDMALFHTSCKREESRLSFSKPVSNLRKQCNVKYL